MTVLQKRHYTQQHDHSTPSYHAIGTGYWLSKYCLLYIDIHSAYISTYSVNLGALPKSNLGDYARNGMRAPKFNTPGHVKRKAVQDSVGMDEFHQVSNLLVPFVGLLVGCRMTL
jgi:hypothetical protein